MDREGLEISGDLMDTGKSPKRNRYLAAVVLGTALAAAGPAQAAPASQVSGQAIQDISRYCTACWRNARLPVDRWSDCTQEVLSRLLERLEPEAWENVLTSDSEERKEFIRAIDAVKKRTQRERHRAALFEDNIADPRHDARDDKDAVRHAASQVLSSRQQSILRMICEGWSVADIANELATTPERVSDEKYKAIQRLRSHFQGHPDGLV
jgi:DNA-directed RNA polymerase specialized sigma subunit